MDNWRSDIAKIREVLTGRLSGITIDGGGNGVTNYNDLDNKPLINGIELDGNRTIEDLGLQPVGNYALSTELPTKLSELENDIDFITADDIPKITEGDNITIAKDGKNITISANAGSGGGIISIPIGTVVRAGWTDDNIPDGFLKEDGGIYLLSDYPNAYNLIGITLNPFAIRPMTSNTTPYPQIASASSTFGAYEPSYLFDDNINTAWASENNFVPDTGYGNEWVMIDIGTVVEFDTVILSNYRQPSGYYGAGAPLDFIFETSLDGTEWDIFKEVIGETWVGIGEDKEYKSAKRHKARFFRITITHVKAKDHVYNAIIAEIKIVDPIAEIATFTMPNSPLDSYGRAQFLKVK